MIFMAETEKGKPVFRTAAPPKQKKVVKSHTYDPCLADWITEEARRRGVSASAFVEQVMNEERTGQKATPEILQGGARVEHLTDLYPREGKLHISSSAIFPEKGPSFGWPHPCEGPADEFVERGIHTFNPRCGGCVNLAASGVPGVYRGA